MRFVNRKDGFVYFSRLITILNLIFFGFYVLFNNNGCHFAAEKQVKRNPPIFSAGFNCKRTKTQFIRCALI